MLILTRRIGESITVGDTVTVKVIGIRAGQVKLGIEAPTEIPVHRAEVFLRIQREKEGDAEHPDQPK